MSRDLSSTADVAINAQETSEVFLVLLEITHADLVVPIRLVNNDVDIIHNSDTYLAFPFRINLPDQAESSAPRAAIEIDNVDRTIVQAISGLTTPADVSIKVVLASSPDTIEVEYVDFKMSGVSYDALVVRADLSLEEFMIEPYPGETFDPGRFPSLF